MLTLQTLTNIETLLMSQSHPLWGEFLPLAQAISEVQAAKRALQDMNVRVQQAQAAPSPPVSTDNSVTVSTVNQTSGVTAEVVSATPAISIAEDD